MSGIQRDQEPNSDPNSDLERRYFKLFKLHWTRGTGRVARVDQYRTEWMTSEFLNRMHKFGTPVTDDTLRNWLRSNNFPHEKHNRAILQVYFGDRENLSAETETNRHRHEMEAAWQQADAWRRRRIDKRPRTTANDPIFEWRMFGEDSIDGLAEVRLHQPRPGNEIGTYYVDATVRVDITERNYGESAVFIGLRDVFLSITSASYQPAKGSMIGERSAHEHAKPGVGGVAFVGPRDEKHGCLAGDLVGDEYIAIIEPTREIEQPVMVMLHAGRRSFSLSKGNLDSAHPTAQLVSSEKDAVLNALIYKGRQKDGQGRVIIAQCRMRRKQRT